MKHLFNLKKVLAVFLLLCSLGAVVGLVVIITEDVDSGKTSLNMFWFIGLLVASLFLATASMDLLTKEKFKE